MKIKIVLIASAFAVLPLATAIPAAARSGVTVDFGNIAVGYRDGYRDHNHQYHRWAHRQDAERYRGQYSQSYRDMNHNRDHDNH